MGFLLSVNIRGFVFHEFPETIKLFYIAHYFRSYNGILLKIMFYIIQYNFSHFSLFFTYFSFPI